MQIDLALSKARTAGVARLDAQLLLGHLLGRSRAWLLAHGEHALEPDQAQAFGRLLARRASGEPLAYLVGEQCFCGLRLMVGPAVLVPRPETEGLVEWALEVLPAAPATKVIDLGTGSGAIALAIKHRRADIEMMASDCSAAALKIAQGNACQLGLAVTLILGNWWAPLAGHRFGLAVANPPYVAEADQHLAALRHEPQLALTPGGDGLGALRQVIDDAPDHLLPGAWLLLEHGHDQAAAVQAMFEARGFALASTRTDLAGLARCTGAVWP